MCAQFIRSRSDKMIAGVCGGLSNYWNVKTTWVRIGFVLFAIIGCFTPVLLYFMLAILMEA